MHSCSQDKSRHFPDKYTFIASAYIHDYCSLFIPINVNNKCDKYYPLLNVIIAGQ